MKDGGRTRKWCRGTLFQVSLHILSITLTCWKKKKQCWLPFTSHTLFPAWSWCQGESHTLDNSESPCHRLWIYFLLLARPLHPPPKNRHGVADWLTAAEQIPSYRASAFRANYFGEIVFSAEPRRFLIGGCRWLVWVCLNVVDSVCVCHMQWPTCFVKKLFWV